MLSYVAYAVIIKVRENPERELSSFPFKVSLQIQSVKNKKGGGNEILNPYILTLKYPTERCLKVEVPMKIINQINRRTITNGWLRRTSKIFQ